MPNHIEFKTADLSSEELLDSYTKKYDPYSDFNFANIYSWNSNDTPSQYAFINDNLVIKRDFYNPFVSLLGTNNIEQTIDTLFENGYTTLSRVPEITLTPQVRARQDFIIEDDRNNWDYILSTKDVSELRGQKYKEKRIYAKRFARGYPNHEVKLLDLCSSSDFTQIDSLVKKWCEKKGDDYSHEIHALKRLAECCGKYKMVNVGIFVNNSLIAFTTNQAVRPNIAMGSFGKADISYLGVFAMLEKVTCEHLLKDNIEFVNFEQDMGIPNLRITKTSWRPNYFLKKYTIKKKC